jgi:hypothetical protein
MNKATNVKLQINLDLHIEISVNEAKLSKEVQRPVNDKRRDAIEKICSLS